MDKAYILLQGLLAVLVLCLLLGVGALEQGKRVKSLCFRIRMLTSQEGWIKSIFLLLAFSCCRI